MYELVKLDDRAYYIECPAKIGVYKVSENEIILIDTGNDKEAAKKVLRVTDAEDWTIKAIYLTHSNADHIGGAEWFKKKTDCKIYATEIEKTFSKYPILESSFLFGGYPMKALRNKFLLAKPCEVETISEEVLPEGLSMISLPGHFFDMIGFKTESGVYFLGDCIFGEEIINKYHFTFIYDVAKYLESLEMLNTLKGTSYVPSHAKHSEDLSELIALNIAKVNEIAAFIVASLSAKPMPFEALLKIIFDHYELTMDMNQYVLVGSTVKSFLSYLVDQGEIEMVFDSNQLIWQKL